MRYTTLALAGIVASAAALALLAGFATTQSPLNSFYAVGKTDVTSEPVDLQALKDLVISPAAGAQGKLEETSWLKLTRYSSVNTAKIKLKLENIEQLTQYFRYLVVQIREAYMEYTGATSYIPPESGRKALGSATSQATEFQSYKLLYSDIFTKIKDTIADKAQGQGLDPVSIAEDILRRVSSATLELVIFDNTTGNPSTVLYLTPENASDIMNAVVELIQNDTGLGVNTFDEYYGSWEVELFPDNDPTKAFFRSGQDYGIWLANSTDRDTFPESAVNYTLVLSFYDQEGEWLFNITWNVSLYWDSSNNDYRLAVGNETITSVYPELVLGNTRATLGFDKPSGWWQPEDVLLVDGGMAFRERYSGLLRCDRVL